MLSSRFQDTKSRHKNNYTSYVKLTNELKKKSGKQLFAISSKILGVALTKQVKDIYTNFKTLKREIEEVAKK